MSLVSIAADEQNQTGHFQIDRFKWFYLQNKVDRSSVGYLGQNNYQSNFDLHNSRSIYFYLNLALLNFSSGTATDAIAPQHPGKLRSISARS